MGMSVFADESSSFAHPIPPEMYELQKKEQGVESSDEEEEGAFCSDEEE